ncbi:MAG: S8 family serine peptidase [Edaphobacter sp.]|uniref:S8 family serine peptidase n=1 Tax=Edaphobacter sp. TaxID=1934404 RepID=UPI00238A4F9F|nr:S8 family serine peptidase [Edaphobacter sp.]MDE1175711.1 S8 family serine peptidase [Edaphobacter sp.]
MQQHALPCFRKTMPKSRWCSTLLSKSMIALIAMTITVSLHAQSEPPSHVPYKHIHELVALSKIRGEKLPVVLVAAKQGKSAAVAQAWKEAGGEVHFLSSEVDYLRGRLPVDKVLTFAVRPDVESLDIDIDINSWDPVLFDSFGEDPDVRPSDPPEPDTPLSHPYLPQKDMDIPAFVAGGPHFDGRGATMAILDATPDMLLPELQHATSLDGGEIPKISELQSSTDPRDDNDPMWVKMDRIVQATDGGFSVEGTHYTAPADGSYRFGFFDERALRAASYLHRDVNFDGNPVGSSGLFAVLWDEASGTVWVDTKQDHDLAHQPGLKDYSKRGDIGIFGDGRRVSGRRKSIGFAIQTNPESHYVHVTLGIWQHVTEVAGASLGKGFMGGAYDGVAGGAQFASYFTGDGSLYRRVESTIAAAQNPKVDVICLEPSIVDLAMNPVHDGRLVAGVIFDRLTDIYKKPLFSPANNTFGMTEVLDEVSSKGIIAVGAYQNAAAYRINNGVDPISEDNLHIVGSFGPSGDGSLKPEIISPSELISTDPGYKPAHKLEGIYYLPPGYYIGGGTSTAGPTATAAAALLVSAAKQENVKYDAARIRTAMLSTARFLPQYPAYQQGNGLVQVNAAWMMLKELNTKWEPITIKSEASVKTLTSKYLQVPDRGTGIFEREGWHARDHGKREILFTRETGPIEPATFDLEWVGNTGVFSTEKTITLPLHKAVALPIFIQTKEEGVASAILNLRRPGYPGIAYQVLNTIVVAQDFKEGNHFTVDETIDAPRPGVKSIFVRVPPGAQALQVFATTPDKRQEIRINLFSPDHKPGLDWSVGKIESGVLQRTIAHPAAGVWEVELWGNLFAFDPKQIDSKPLKPVPVHLELSVLGVDVVPTKKVAGIAPNQAEYQVQMKNLLAPFVAAVDTSSLGSQVEEKGQISSGEQKTFSIEVPEGSERLVVQVNQQKSSEDDLDLYLYHVQPDGLAVLRGSGDSQGSTEELTIDHPAGGKWIAVVDGFRVPNGATTFTYRDTFFHPLLGTVDASDKPKQRRQNEEWNSAVNVRVNARPTGKRILVEPIAVVVNSSPGEKPSSDPLATVPGGGKPLPARIGSSVLLSPAQQK